MLPHPPGVEALLAPRRTRWQILDECLVQRRNAPAPGNEAGERRQPRTRPEPIQRPEDGRSTDVSSLDTRGPDECARSCLVDLHVHVNEMGANASAVGDRRGRV